MPIARDIAIATCLLGGAVGLIYAVFRTPEGASASAQDPMAVNQPLPPPTEGVQPSEDPRVAAPPPLPPAAEHLVLQQPVGPTQVPPPAFQSPVTPPLPAPGQPPAGPSTSYRLLLGETPTAPVVRQPGPQPSPTPVEVSARPAAPASVGSGPRAAQAQTHTVGQGEMLGDIARRYYGSSASWRTIADANGIRDARDLRIGQKLQIPAAAASPSSAAARGSEGATARDAAPRYGAPPRPPRRRADGSYTLGFVRNPVVNRPAAVQRGAPDAPRTDPVKPAVSAGNAEPRATPAPVSDTAAGPGAVHVVRRGETLQDISSRYYRTTRKWTVIRDANPGVNPNRLSEGQRLRIPDAQVAPVPPTALPTVPDAGAARPAPALPTAPELPPTDLLGGAGVPALPMPPPPPAPPASEAPRSLPGLDEPGLGGAPPPPGGFGG